MVNHPNRRRSVKEKAVSTSALIHNHDHDYSALLIGVRASFGAAVTSGARLFATDADGLNDLYLDSLPSERQVHNCHCCKRFIGTYGNLVTIAEDGETVPVMWNPESVPEFYRPAFAALYARVKKARVTSIFLSKETIWGTPETGAWSHISVVPPSALVYRPRALAAWQAMAAAKENFRTVATALTELTAPMLDQALRLLSADTLARSEKFIGPAKWLRDLHDRPKGRRGENVLWRAIASAPEGYCHPKASVIGPLLDDIAAGLPFDDIKARFDAKLHPLQYQRPQAAPSAGTIKAAEELVAKLGIAPSLERRFARVDELESIWSPAPAKDAPPAKGVFGHLAAKGTPAVKPVDLPVQTMTWDKFSRTVLPSAERMELRVPGRGNFEARLTAVHADAPQILKWDNPVSAYVYHGGSQAEAWNLAAGTWVSVVAISPRPNLWGSNPKPHLGEGLLMVLDGCIDTRTGQGNALFPECLKDDLHGVRAVIEAYSKRAEIVREEGPYGCGIGIAKGSAACSLRVFSSGGWSSYNIDRWD